MFGSAFNRAPFNRVESSGSFVWAGDAHAVATGSAILVINARMIGRADAVATAIANFDAGYSIDGIAHAVATATADQIRRRFMSGKAEAVATATAGGLYIVGNEFLILDGITLAAGDDVEIDTERMTLMINGINGIPYLTDDSTFFMLSDNDIIHIEGSGTATVTLLWKDRWLG